jgi:hypothetical protein
MVDRWHRKLCTISWIDGERDKWSSGEKPADLGDHARNLMLIAAQIKMIITQKLYVVDMCIHEDNGTVHRKSNQ